MVRISLFSLSLKELPCSQSWPGKHFLQEKGHTLSPKTRMISRKSQHRLSKKKKKREREEKEALQILQHAP